MRALFILLVLTFSINVFAQSGREVWSEELNTAKNVAYLTTLEQQVIFELNKVRSDPKRFAEEYMEDLQTCFSGKLFTYPGQETVITKEGVAPLLECLRVLEKAAPVQILRPVQGLSKASGILVNDQQKHGGIGHIARDGSTPQKRIEKFGRWDICSAEDITYGSFEARQIVISLLIDDGVPDRGHRDNVLNPCFHFVGLSSGKHPTYDILFVIDYAGDYQEKR